jgi:hypothetical protein
VAVYVLILRQAHRREGAERRFVTPPLEVGKKYHYEIRG